MAENDEIQLPQRIPVSNLAQLNLRPVASKHFSKESDSHADLTVVRTEKFGNRITMSKVLYEKIGCPANIGIEMFDSGIVVRASHNSNDFRVRKSEGKPVIYCAALVRELTEMFQLDFAGRTSLSFYGASYLPNGDATVAVIHLKTDEIGNGQSAAEGEEETDEA